MKIQNVNCAVRMTVMASWNISRHPEWDQMYLAGLTAREIAEYCHVNLATVHLHLKKRAKYQPDFRVLHENALALRHPDRPTFHWKSRLGQVKKFIVNNKRYPCSSGESLERTLFLWLARQRRSYKSGEMSPGKTYLLSQLPDWESFISEDYLEEKWQSSLNELAEYVHRFNALPRYHNYSSAVEHHLGVWLHNQHQKRSKGLLPKNRMAALEIIYPGWRSRW